MKAEAGTAFHWVQYRINHIVQFKIITHPTKEDVFFVVILSINVIKGPTACYKPEFYTAEEL